MADHSPRTSAQNTPDIALIIENDAISMMRIGVDVLEQLEELFKTIREIAEENHLRPTLALSRIGKLSAIGAYAASDTCNCIDVGRERFEHDHLPVILAATQGGAR